MPAHFSGLVGNGFWALGGEAGLLWFREVGDLGGGADGEISVADHFTNLLGSLFPDLSTALNGAGGDIHQGGGICCANLQSILVLAGL